MLSGKGFHEIQGSRDLQVQESEIYILRLNMKRGIGKRIGSFFKRKRVKRLWVLLLVGCGLLAGLIGVCNQIIVRSTSDKVYADVAEVPANRVGLLLGTSPKLRSGRPNLYFHHRIDAAVALYQAGKINYVLVSGDNRRRNYNEPAEMRKALIAKGIPDSVIVLDYAGIRTLDSVIRSEKIFGQDSITIISQRFHNERAIYIACRNDIVAVGFNAKDVDAYSGFKTNLRELLARVKVFVDILTGKGPRHLGDPVVIGEAG